jgi:hypothetical protein
MALGNRKIAEVFNKRTGDSSNARSITDSKELEIKAEFDAGVHIADEGMFNTISPALYAIQKLSEDIDEIRRHVSSDINGISTSQANAITANSAKISYTDQVAVAANTDKRSAKFIYIPIVCNFYGDLSTGEYHVPFSDGETESTSTTNRRNQFVAPCDGNFHKVIIRSNNSTLERSAATRLTVKSKKVSTGGASVTTLETKNLDTAAAETPISTTFDSTNSAFSEGDRLLLSLQLTQGAPRGSKSFFVTVVFKINQADLD